MATSTLTGQVQEGGQARERRMAQNLYSPRVRLGNWNEDIYLEEELMKDFLEKREKGQLLIQRNRRLKENLLRPVILNSSTVFKILSNQVEDRNAMGQVLRYGQNFCLAITGGFEGKMLYLSSDHRTLLKSSKRSWLQEVYLTDEVSYLNCWQAAFLDPQLRLEYEGYPIPANAKVIINHCHTNRGLAAHRHLFLSTYFGKEAEVAAHTHLDSHRVEKPRNHWMLVTGNPRKDLSTMLDLPKPPAEDSRALEQATKALEQAMDPGVQ
ncbi:cilia- and flagella-associated protein 161 isoform X4 [Canis aureus]